VSRFEAGIARVFPDHLFQFGRTGVRYLDEPHAEPVDLTAIVGPERTDELDGETGRKLRITREVTILTDPDSDYGGVASPKMSATIEIDGVEWTIAPPVTVDGNTATLTVSRSPQVERGRAGYRGHG